MSKPSEIGKIKSLALLDFLTFDELKYTPGDYLNIIIGPNGTGKSTIVAGIILGCGGKPQVLSRSKDISDYVKNGKEKARIEIEIAANDQGRVVTFHRAFDKRSKESFSIDGTIVSSKQYLLRIKEFNIQVDNLCMFLPQDRVQDFTKMNPQELLHNTQTSVCSEEINKAFEKLLTTRDRQKNNTKAKADIETRLTDNRNRNEQLRVLIENNKLKNKLLADADVILKKKAWCEFNELETNYKEVERDMKSSAELLKAKTKELEPYKKRQDEVAGTKLALKNAISKATTSINANMQEMNKLEIAATKTESLVNDAKQDIKNIINSAQDHKKQIQELKIVIKLDQSELQEAKNALEAEGRVDEKMHQFDGRIGVIKSLNEKLVHQRSGITSHLEDTINPSIRNCERKIANLGDTQKQRVDNLRNHFEDAYKAFIWLQSNRQNFRGRIFNPVMVEIAVKEKDCVKYVENTVSNKDLQAFICTDKDDMQQLVKKLRNEMKLQVNVAYAEDTTEVDYESDRNVQEYPSNLGIYCHMIDVIEGPAPVINYLCKLYTIHNVAIGDDQTFKNASKVPDNIRLFFSTNHRFCVNISKYSGAKSVTSNQIGARNILNVGINNRMKDQEEKNLAKWKRDAEVQHNNRAKIEAEIKENEVKLAAVRNEKKEVQMKINRVRNSQETLRKKEIEHENLVNRRINVDVERKKFKNKVDELVGKLIKINEKRLDGLNEFKNLNLKLQLAQKKLEVFESSTGNLDETIRMIQQEIDNKRALHIKVKETYERTKDRYNLKLAEVLKLTDGLAPDHPKFKYKKKFQKLTDDLDELHNMFDDIQGRIKCIAGIDPIILTEYEERTKEIEDLENQLANEANLLEKLEKDLTELHAKWFPAITDIIQTINNNFSEFFTMMGFVGEVEMIRKEERDYADYGIQIRVQYRDNEKLQALNRHVQSGGERAVAIAVYTLSLQHITNVPFRCVDEINQGMDPKNERKIFQMLVDITCHADQSQYFFVTPKLLPELPCHELMEVHVVYNGKNIEDSYIFLDE